MVKKLSIYEKEAKKLEKYKEKAFKKQPEHLKNIGDNTHEAEKYIFKISIDRLTILGDWNYYLSRVHPFQHLINTVNAGDDIYISTLNPFKGRINKKIFWESVNTKVQRHAREFRLDFNPNKLNDKEVHFIADDVIPLLQRVGSTRIDIAVDIELDLSDYIFYESGNPRSRWIAYSKTLDVETINLGSPESDNLLTVYNKKLERHKVYKKYSAVLDKWNKSKAEYEIQHKDKKYPVDEPTLEQFGLSPEDVHNIFTKEHWWRVEFKLKGDLTSDYLDIKKFANTLMIFKPAHYSADSWEEQAKIEWLMSDITRLKTHIEHRGTRQKYLILIKKQAPYDLMDGIVSLYEKYKNKIEKKYLSFVEKANYLWFNIDSIFTQQEILDGKSDHPLKNQILKETNDKKKAKMLKEYRKEINYEPDVLKFDSLIDSLFKNSFDDDYDFDILEFADED